MQTIDDLNDLRFVAAIAHHGTLAGAARQLGVNHATAFRRLEALERKLGVRLFERGAGRYSPTPAGEELARTGALIEQEALQSMLKVAGQDLRPSGVVRVTTTDTIATVFLPALASDCQQHHPGISLHVTTGNELHNLSRRDADIAVRPAEKPPEHLIGKRIGVLAMAAYGERSYLRRTRAVKALGDHPWVAVDESLSYHRSLKWLGRVAPAASLAYRTNSFLGLQQACASGLGLAVLPCFVADADKRLQRVTPPLEELQVMLWLLMHPDLRKTARVATVFDFLYRQLGSQTERLAGTG
jgi:DNA-binding transcriptional LysR family regulator